LDWYASSAILFLHIYLPQIKTNLCRHYQFSIKHGSLLASLPMGYGTSHHAGRFPFLILSILITPFYLSIPQHMFIILASCALARELIDVLPSDII
jgi:hypothetical protein